MQAVSLGSAPGHLWGPSGVGTMPAGRLQEASREDVSGCCFVGRTPGPGGVEQVRSRWGIVSLGPSHEGVPGHGWEDRTPGDGGSCTVVTLRLPWEPLELMLGRCTHTDGVRVSGLFQGGISGFGRQEPGGKEAGAELRMPREVVVGF